MSRGAFTVETEPEDPVYIVCEKCGQRGRYRRATLLAMFGPDESMPHVLNLVANCPRHGNPSDPCGVRYEWTLPPKS